MRRVMHQNRHAMLPRAYEEKGEYKGERIWEKDEQRHRAYDNRPNMQR
jgi:hypothetical protein